MLIYTKKVYVPLGMTEKRKPTYDLEAFKARFSSVDGLAVSGSAIKNYIALGFTASDVVDTMQTMRREQFYKSMTAYNDSRQWQDVYHVPSSAGVLYIKFTADVVTEFRLLSFKEK